MDLPGPSPTRHQRPWLRPPQTPVRVRVAAGVSTGLPRAGPTGGSRRLPVPTCTGALQPPAPPGQVAAGAEEAEGGGGDHGQEEGQGCGQARRELGAGDRDGSSHLRLSQRGRRDPRRGSVLGRPLPPLPPAEAHGTACRPLRGYSCPWEAARNSRALWGEHGPDTRWRAAHPLVAARFPTRPAGGADPGLPPQCPADQEAEAAGGRPARWLLGGGTGGRPPEAQAALLLGLGDEQAQVPAAGAMAAGPAAEGEGLAAEARVPGVVLVQVPQAAGAGQRCGRGVRGCQAGPCLPEPPMVLPQ